MNENTPIFSVNIKDEMPSATQGLSLFATSIFLVGQMAGSGVLALPKAVVNTGWIGFVIIILYCVISIYTGVRLGNCWEILKERWPEYRQQVRYPYPAIGEKALGKYGRILVSLCNNLTLFGVSTVFLLLASENIYFLFLQVNVNVIFCYWLLVIGGCLAPFMWLGSPKDFWFIGLIAMMATLIACGIIVISSLLNESHHTVVTHSSPTFESFATSFGTMVFAFGGHSVFPTVQHDMKEPKNFGWSVSLAYLIILVMYLPVCIAGYVVFGDSVDDNILNSLIPGPLRFTTTILITLHLLFGFIIVINPFCQDVEEFFKIPTTFGWKRCLIRASTMILVLLVAEAVPRFSTILNLIGGTTVTVLAFIFPSLFYIKLCRMKSEEWNEREVPLYELVLNCEIIIIGVLGGVSATYATFEELSSPSNSTQPCFLKF